MRIISLALMLVLITSRLESMPIARSAQATTGTVAGSLMNDDGTPNANAKISVLYYSGGPIESVSRSDSNGNFSFSGIPIDTSASVVVYDSDDHVVAKGSAIIQSGGDTVTVELQSVPVTHQ
jgi:hypothetical protein